MSTDGIAAAATAANQAQVKMALAAKIAKMDAAAQQSVADLLESADADMKEMASSALPEGLGANLDTSA